MTYNVFGGTLNLYTTTRRHMYVRTGNGSRSELSAVVIMKFRVRAYIHNLAR